MEKLKIENMLEAFSFIIDELKSIKSLINNKNEAKLEKDETLLNIDEVSKYLNISKQTIYLYTSQNKIPHTKKGRRCYFFKNQINEWLKDSKIKTIKELQTELKNI